MNSRARNISDGCANGHSVKHIDEFNDLGIETPEQYKEHVNNVLESRETECFSAYSTNQTWRQADVFYHEPTNTLVVVPENHSNEPTAYRSENGKNEFEKKHKEAERIENRNIEKYKGIDELEQAKQSKDISQTKSTEQPQTHAKESEPIKKAEGIKNSEPSQSTEPTKIDQERSERVRSMMEAQEKLNV